MSDKKKKFHQIALQSSLFKGRSDWYFCFLKSERIAHVLAVLCEHAAEKDKEALREVRDSSSDVPHSIAHMAADEYEVRQILSEIFSLIASVRILSTRKTLAPETARILLEELESLVERLDEGERISPFVTSEDFALPPFPFEDDAKPLPPVVGKWLPSVPPMSKGQDVLTKGHMSGSSKGQNERAQQILNFVLKNQGVSIKDISSVVTDCSEKTIQRELAELIRQGLITKTGERRWSIYLPPSERPPESR
jgi:hypothetical protein